MIRSMTGFGKGSAADEVGSVTIEVRSVNARGREARFRLPSDLHALEPLLRERVQDAVARGRVDVSLSFDRGSQTRASLELDAQAARAAVVAWRTIAEDNGLDEPPQIAAILRVPGVLEPVADRGIDLEAVSTLAARALDAALDAHREAREIEGRRLVEDLRERHATIRRLVDEIAERSEGHAEAIVERIRERLAPLLAEIPVDEVRVAQEAAVVAQRSDVTEELVRLEAHLERWAAQHEPGAEQIGRLLEFLVQEVRREVTTLSAKLGTPEVDERVLTIKTELERVREQAANLE